MKANISITINLIKTSSEWRTNWKSPNRNQSTCKWARRKLKTYSERHYSNKLPKVLPFEYLKKNSMGIKKMKKLNTKPDSVINRLNKISLSTFGAENVMKNSNASSSKLTTTQIFMKIIMLLIKYQKTTLKNSIVLGIWKILNRY